ncbi:MAG TPA: 2-C-methyl-D-erythritol 2,4-cyclodiphosphate synthase [Actinobacteria bacterium]|jgi:2-C-methyl-D-erythritol 2,4-cyclodiphosphate synthase|nr:2-C-methyl-D-erythritol 2,4-cyclodiphosphate synthase [Actinomycetota bacterium]
MFRIGIGYDVHRFTDDRELILGGVRIDYKRGLAGHSDADVLIHAINDAILGACCLGDIGTYFPDTDNAYKNISSLVLLEKVVGMMKECGYSLVNCDNILILEKPRIALYIQRIREKLFKILETDINAVSVKATTTEKLGFCGREEGIAAQSVVLLKKVKKI